MAVQILIIATMAVVTVAICIEITAWIRGTRLITSRQKLYRVTAAAMMDAVLVMVLFDGAVHAKHNPYFELSYWGTAIVISFLLVVVALLDVRVALQTFSDRRKDIFQSSFGDERREE